MKSFITILSICWSLALTGQTVASFENFDLPVDAFLNNSDVSGEFRSGNVLLPNDFNPEFDVWSGWAVSTMTDTLTPGFMNQYSAITGAGVEGSLTYAVSFVSGESIIILEGQAAGGVVEGLYVTNSTYAFLSMRDGDAFAKKFGGETGDDPDFFLLTVKKYLNGALSADSVNFYLADFRFEDNSMDYIVDEWTYLDLTSLGNADSLVLTLTSSDVGAFGINTPTYFCVDNITTADMVTAAPSPEKEPPVKVFPNPAADYLELEWPGTTTIVTIINSSGQGIRRQTIEPGRNAIGVQNLPAGLYWLQWKDGRTQAFVKGGPKD